MQEATNQAVNSIADIGQVIGKLSEIAQAVSAAIAEQSATTQDIARNVEQAAKVTEEVAQNVVEVTDGARHTGKSAGDVLSASLALSKQSSNMSAGVGRFMLELRKVA